MQIPLHEFKLAGIEDLLIDDIIIEPKVMNTIKIYAGKLPSDTKINVYAHVLHTGVPGPSVLLLGGVHGNEINGIEVVRRSVEQQLFETVKRGTVIIVPLLNIYGFINFSRSVPDGKDVNRSFPGHLNGSLASRVARVITRKILPYVDVAIDFHTGGDARYNFPQVRYEKYNRIAEVMAMHFKTKYVIEQPLIPYSFRKAAHDMKVPAIVYEGGESIRLDPLAIEQGLNGIKNVLNALEMTDFQVANQEEPRFIIHKTKWVRASSSGLFIWCKPSGGFVEKGDLLGEIKDPFGTKSVKIVANTSGHIVGHNNACVVSLGDALFHIGHEYSEI
ncbi:MAG: succinylglutamate desuccinylase/aspartoacylase family protein [Chitinophagales bacterium]|nr:succinylglutamate desuccinylase/aspartoacylase family protein [Chitinophagales bacterium]